MLQHLVFRSIISTSIDKFPYTFHLKGKQINSACTHLHVLGLLEDTRWLSFAMAFRGIELQNTISGGVFHIYDNPNENNNVLLSWPRSLVFLPSPLHRHSLKNTATTRASCRVWARASSPSNWRATLPCLRAGTRRAAAARYVGTAGADADARPTRWLHVLRCLFNAFGTIVP